MKVKFYRTGVCLIAESDTEASLLSPIADALNANAGVPARLTDNLEGGPEHRIMNAVLDISTDTGV